MRLVTQLFARAGTNLALLGFLVGIGLMAVAFLSAALYLALIEPLGAPLAALATGGVLTVAGALILLSVRRSVSRWPSPPNASAPTDGRAAAGKLGEMLGEEAGMWTKQHPGAAMLAAMLAGFVVGSSPKIRSKLTDLLD